MKQVSNFPARSTLASSVRRHAEAMAMVSGTFLGQKTSSLTGKFFSAGEQPLSPLMKRAYDWIVNSEEYSSSVPEMLIPKSPRSPSGFVSVPISKPIRRIVVFFHGYGCNGLWNVYLANELFPNDVVLSPSTGWACDEVEADDLQNWIDEATLMIAEADNYRDAPQVVFAALSQGADPAVSLLNKTATECAGLCCITTYPLKRIKRRRKGLPVGIIYGGEDARVTPEEVAESIDDLQDRGFEVLDKLVPGADHFLSLSDTPLVKRFVTRWLKSIANPSLAK